MFQIALFGAGRIGQIHAANAASHPALSLKYVVDPVSSVAEALATKHGAQVATIEHALEDAQVEGVIVSSSTDRHLEQCLAAASAGKAIFCEKPLDLALDRVRSAADALSSARLLVGFNRRFDPSFRALKASLEADAVGPLETLHIVSHDPAPPPISYVKVSGGLFKDMAIHDFDMARWLLPEPPIEVFAMASCLVDPEIGKAGDVDTAKTLLRTAGGHVCVISNSRRSGYGYDQRIEAFGSKGAVRANNAVVNTLELWSEPGASAASFQNFFLDRYAKAYQLEMDHFAAVLSGARPDIGFSDGLLALELAEAAARSLTLAAPVRLE